VGRFLERRFGRQVTDRLVDPVLGSLHSGDVRRLSLRAATPTLAAMADRRRSLVMRRRPSPHAGPTFVTLRCGLGSLPERLRATLPDVEVRLSCSVLAVERHGGALRLHLEDGATLAADGVVLAVPARAARRIVADASPVASGELARLRAASVAVAVLAYPAAAAATPALAGTGVLVPSSRRRLLKAATFLSTKWPHHGGQRRVLVRASAGRAGDERAVELSDDELVAGLHADLREATGVTVVPTDARVHRWRSSLPQLEVGHVERIEEASVALRRDLPGVVLAGAPYHGPGVAACLRSAATAAQQILDHDQERAR
jgi:protoporphyrinogen/coproporphyrinogen III oxidase